MFQGVVCGSAREMIARYVKDHGPFAGAHVLCSGNLSIETTLRMNGHTGRLTGSDVSTYTCALGTAIAGGDLPMKMNRESDWWREWMEPFDDWMAADQDSRAAAVALLLDLMPMVSEKNQYERRMLQGYISRLGKMLATTLTRVRKKKDEVRLEEFHARDAWERAAELPDGDLVLTFPPTYELGYEKLYKRLDSLVAWERPGYKELTSGAEFAQRIVSAHAGPWIIGAEERKDEQEAIVGKPIGQATRGGQKNVYLYSSLELEPLVVRRQVPVEPVAWPFLKDDDELSADSKLEVHEIGSNAANYIRQLFVSVEVGQAAAQWAHAVTVDGKICGVLMWQAWRLFPVMVDKQDRTADTMYMMADLCVPSDRYPRLSKLVLLASLAHETKEWLRKKAIQRVDLVLTTAFSKHPVSMKYRGVYDLLKRERENGVWKLNYIGRTGEWTLQQAMRAWHERHCSKTL